MRVVLMLACLAKMTLPCAAAQGPDELPREAETYAHHAFSKLLEGFRADSSLPDSLRQLTIGRLDSLPTRTFNLLDDSSTQLYLQAMGSILRQMPARRCAAVLRHGDEMALTSLLADVGSGTVDTLVVLYERTIRAMADPRDRKVATRTETQWTIIAITQKLSSADQQRLATMQSDSQPSQEDVCWFGRTIIDGLAAMPERLAAPVFRSMHTPAPAR